MMPAESNLGAHPAPLAAAERHRLLVGLFLPIQDGGWSPSTAPRGTTWTFPYNAALTQRAEAFGFDLAFGLAQWLPKGGHGGRMRYREMQIDPLMATAGLAALTRRIVLISTVHVLYGWHPLELARMGATLNALSGGRWGLNVVTGYKREESAMFGIERIPHDRRYEMAGEFVRHLLALWQAEAPLTREGDWWRLEEATLGLAPGTRRPIVVNAAASPEGIDFAARYADLMFITSPSGFDVDKACTTLPDYIAGIDATAATHGRKVRTIINPHIVCRETDREAQDRFREIAEAVDQGAVAGFTGAVGGGDQKAWRGHDKAGFAVGGNVHIVGSPETVTQKLIGLAGAGVGGVQICFFDFAPDLEFFGTRVLPLMRQAGLRAD